MGKSQLRNIVDRIVKMVESTGRKQTKEELRMFRTISDQANSGASISSLDGTFIYVNDTLARMVGWENN